MRKFLAAVFAAAIEGIALIKFQKLRVPALSITLAAVLGFAGLLPVPANSVEIAPRPAAVNISSGDDGAVASDLSVKVSRDGSKAAAIWTARVDDRAPQALQFASATFDTETGYWSWATPQTIFENIDLGSDRVYPGPNFAISDDGSRVLITWSSKFDRSDYEVPDVDFVDDSGTEVYTLMGSYSSDGFTFGAPVLNAFISDESIKLDSPVVAMTGDGQHAMLMFRKNETLLAKSGVLNDDAFLWDDQATAVSAASVIETPERFGWSSKLAIGSTGTFGEPDYRVSALAAWRVGSTGKVMVANAVLSSGRLAWKKTDDTVVAQEFGIKIGADGTQHATLAMTSSTTAPIRAVLAYNQPGANSTDTQANAGTHVQGVTAEDDGSIDFESAAATQAFLFGYERQPHISLKSDGSQVVLTSGDQAISGSFDSNGLTWVQRSQAEELDPGPGLLVGSGLRNTLINRPGEDVGVPMPLTGGPDLLSVAAAVDTGETIVAWRKEVNFSLRTLNFTSGEIIDGKLTWAASQEISAATPFTYTSLYDPLFQLSAGVSGDGTKVAILWITAFPFPGPQVVQGMGPDSTSPVIGDFGPPSLYRGETKVGTFTADEPAIWSISGGADQELFEIDPLTGDLNFVNESAPGTYLVEITATDGSGNSSTPATVTVTVRNGPELTIPSTYNVAIGETVVATFSQGGIVDWYLDGGEDESLFSLSYGTTDGVRDFSTAYLTFKNRSVEGVYYVVIFGGDDSVYSARRLMVIVGEFGEGDGQDSGGDGSDNENSGEGDSQDSGGDGSDNDSSGASPSVFFELPVIQMPAGGARATSGGELTLEGENLERVRQVEVNSKSAEIKSQTGTSIRLGMPQLEIGTYDLTLTSDMGRLTIQSAVMIVAGSAVLAPDALKTFRVWTQINEAKTQVRMYAKAPVLVGKVQFKLNGREIAWVRAIDETDPKLLERGQALYLLRTVNLSAKQNVFEIYLDGKRIWRASYKGRWG